MTSQHKREIILNNIYGLDLGAVTRAQFSAENERSADLIKYLPRGPRHQTPRITERPDNQAQTLTRSLTVAFAPRSPAKSLIRNLNKQN